jgi:hypothetical protein
MFAYCFLTKIHINIYDSGLLLKDLALCFLEKKTFIGVKTAKMREWFFEQSLIQQLKQSA